MNEFKCEWCGATASKNSRQPFTADRLVFHQMRCPKRPAPTVVPTVDSSTVGNEVIRDGGKSMKSTSPTVKDRPSLSSLEEEKNNTADASAVVGEEQTGENQSIRALWAKHKYDRDRKGRPVFSRFEHSLMAREWRYLTAKQRDTVIGIHAALRAHAIQVQQDELEARGTPEEQREREGRQAQAEADRLEREAWDAHNAEFWRENGYMDPPTPSTLNIITGEPEPPRKPLPRQQPREMTEAEIAETWSDFARPWLLAKKAFLAGALDGVNWTPESRKVYDRVMAQMREFNIVLPPHDPAEFAAGCRARLGLAS